MSPLIPLLALLSIGDWPTTFPHVRIALALDARLPAAVAHGAVEETASVWAPYGVSVAALDRQSAANEAGDRPGEVALTVRLAERDLDPARVWSSPFGSIRFLPDGEPEPTILLHYDVIIKLGLSTISLGSAREPHWPGSVRDRVLGRMIGRVVAHEIGHWLLRSREHSAAGLMRAQQTTAALAAPGREGFTLTRAELARLRAALTK
jgi:hypothetical protein